MGTWMESDATWVSHSTNGTSPRAPSTAILPALTVFEQWYKLNHLPLLFLHLLLGMHAASSSKIHGKYPLLPIPLCVPQSLWGSPCSVASFNLLRTTCSWPLCFCVCCPLFLDGPFLPSLLRPLPAALGSGDTPWKLC